MLTNDKEPTEREKELAREFRAAHHPACEDYVEELLAAYRRELWRDEALRAEQRRDSPMAYGSYAGVHHPMPASPSADTEPPAALETQWYAPRSLPIVVACGWCGKQWDPSVTLDDYARHREHECGGERAVIAGGHEEVP